MGRSIFLCLLLLVGATVAFGAGSAKDISSAEAKAIIDKTKNVFILDVRTPEERRQGFIKDSVLIPIDVIERRLQEVPKNRPVIVYCAVGSRSRVVAQGLSQMGYGQVYSMRDGIAGWQRSGLPVMR